MKGPIKSHRKCARCNNPATHQKGTNNQSRLCARHNQEREARQSNHKSERKCHCGVTALKGSEYCRVCKSAEEFFDAQNKMKDSFDNLPTPGYVEIVSHHSAIKGLPHGGFTPMDPMEFLPLGHEPKRTFGFLSEASQKMFEDIKHPPTTWNSRCMAPKLIADEPSHELADILKQVNVIRSRLVKVKNRLNEISQELENGVTSAYVASIEIASISDAIKEMIE